MPFIRGRYHINPIMGEALEAAREAEAALLALEQRAQNDRQQEGQVADDDSSAGSCGSGDSPGGPRPIHRVEVEAAELVPSHSGRAARGFVARIHRQTLPASNSARTAPGGGLQLRPSPDAPASCDTHVFANHEDLIDFLRDQLAQDSGRRSPRS